MKYSIGQNLADFGFAFLEKVHEPIFLINKLGRVVKINEAGRKLLSISRIGLQTFEEVTRLQVSEKLKAGSEFIRFQLHGTPFQIIAHQLTGSDFVLVEIHRRLQNKKVDRYSRV